jgi:hypothetical protein
LNNKGQFYIIAALLVLVVITATVVTTFSVIRYDSISDQPQVLSAVDETNLALKQLLGFTVGYYGSILRVTGNTSYAQNLAKAYLQSGLGNIADIKPEWGLSFNITDVDLHVDWFLPTSNSSGQFSISYDLTGLGFYNLTCTIQKILNVQVLSSVSSGEARISIHREDDEPVTILSMNNFKFYRFDSENQTWEPVAPTIEPVVFANGTYLISVPSGVVTTSYIVQVKDNRGISVIASSCSRYVATLNWTTGGGGEVNYVDKNDSDVDSSANNGSSSNFTAQQAGPDSSYDTLTEVNTGGGDTNTTLITGESFEGTFPPTGWSITTGSYWSKSSSGQGYDGSYSAYFDGGSSRSGYLTSPSVDSSGAAAVYVDFWYKDAGCESGEFRLQYYDGASWDTITDLGATTSTQWLHYQQTITDSQYFKSNFMIRIRMNTNNNDDNAYVDLFNVIKEVSSSNYTLDLEEQWTSVNMTNPLQKLCIKTGTMGTEALKVDVWNSNSSTWVNLINGLAASAWNNVSVNQYLSENFTIRFKGSTETSDHTQTSWAIDAVLLQPQSGLGDMLAQQKDSTVAVEWLQNGTMRVLGQNLQLSTLEMPIPPVSAKGFHLNQTIDGVDQEVPFQIEDWASEYRVPQGLTNNMTVFSNRQMLVFLLNRSVTQVTLWWNGSDQATQTPLAYRNTHFSYTPSNRTLNNGRLAIQFAPSGFNITSTLNGSTSTANFMRINTDMDDTDPELAYVITDGVVRDIVQGEPEWHDGPDNCPNVYASVVITLPAGTSYFTYQLRLMFMNSTQARTITDLCSLRLTTSLSSPQFKTENGTTGDSPIAADGTGTFHDYDAGSTWTPHHWSQFTSGNNGAGIIFKDSDNQKLYAFDSMAGNATGALNVSSTSIELAPVTSLHQVSFTTPMDIIWTGAVATFDTASTPIYYNDGQPAGLWILAEFQPQITVTAET